MLTFKAVDMFFDRAAVIADMDETTRRALSKAGAFIRTRARTSMRRRRGVSPPGQPPSAHQGDLKRFLYFAWDPATRSVVVGPVGFSQSRVPSILEIGGPSATRVYNRATGRREDRPITVRPRPYMGPALAQEIDSIPPLFRLSSRTEAG